MQLAPELVPENSVTLSQIARVCDVAESETAAVDDQFKRIVEYVLEKDYELLQRLAK